MFFKKELKKHINAENNPDPRQVQGKTSMQHIITKQTHQNLSIDQAQSHVTDKLVGDIVDEMSSLPFDYSADFKLKKIVNEQEKLMQAKKKKENQIKNILNDKRFKSKEEGPKKVYFSGSNNQSGQNNTGKMK